MAPAQSAAPNCSIGRGELATSARKLGGISDREAGPPFAQSSITATVRGEQGKEATAMGRKLNRFCEWYSKQHPAVKVVTVLGVAAGAAVAGIAAAPAVGAAVSAAGFGVAGGTLSGAAASSAGLAALGGGAIAVEGAGVVGGTAVVSAVAATLGGATSAGIAVKTNAAGKKSRERHERARRTTVDDGDYEWEEV
ncbi:MAG: hypothetical protein KDC27_10335 [Acidobacteria bacterium]|nr:hypothetical protein [Acidobacteriota bacterium]